MLREPIDIPRVEDDPDDLAPAADALNEEHVRCRMQVARDGEEAFALPTPPMADGRGALGQMQRDPRTRALPVARPASSKQPRDPMQGYHGCIRKPIDFDQFQAEIQQPGYYRLALSRPPQPACEGGA